MNDSINRAAAVRVVEDECKEFKEIFNRIKERLNNLPCAQPTVILCEDCKWWSWNKRLNIPWCKARSIETIDSDFCSYAERKENE